MSNVRIPASSPLSQMTSPLFSRLSLEIRLLIFQFVFLSCTTEAWFDGEFDDGETTTNQRLGQRRPRVFRSDQCCFSHWGGGFELLVTCRQAYDEAYETYWAHTILAVARSIDEQCIGCGLVSVCKYLDPIIKENVRHLLNIKLPIMEMYQSAPGDPTWTPALLKQFPRLVSLEITSWVLFGQLPNPMARPAGGSLISVPDADSPVQTYTGVGPFQVLTGESPAEYMERRIGVKRSHGVMLLSWTFCPRPHGALPGYKHRLQFFNWTTGMVYQTTERLRYKLDGYREVMDADEGSGWSRWGCVHQNRRLVGGYKQV